MRKKMIELNKQYNTCNCGGSLIQNKHELVCSTCGLIHDDIELMHSTRVNDKSINDDGNKEQFVSVGNTITNIHNLGSLFIKKGWVFYDWKGTQISKDLNKYFLKMDKHKLIQRFWNGGNLPRHLTTINRLAVLLELPRMFTDRVAFFYRKIKAKHHIPNGFALICACFLYASKEDPSFNVSIDDIIEYMNGFNHAITFQIVRKYFLKYKDQVNYKNNEGKTLESQLIPTIETILDADQPKIL